MRVITLIATVTAKAGQEAVIEPLLVSLVEPSRKDEGNLQYHLYRVQGQPTVFMFYEQWQSQALLDQHMQTPHFLEFMRQADGRLEGVDMKFVEEIG